MTNPHPRPDPAARPAGRAAPEKGVEKARLVIFGASLLGMLVAALNMTVVGTALPRIAADLNSLKDYPWVFTTFMVTSAATLPIFGKLSDLYGRKPFFMGGIGTLLAGSILAGTSQDILQLAVYRGVQGVGVGALMSSSMAIVGDLFPPSEVGKWRALNQAVFTLASMLGPLVGGLITDNLSWRWVFYVNVPLGLLALAVAGAVLPSRRGSQKQRHAVDYLGAIALLVAMGPLLVGFSWAGQRYAWDSALVVGLLAFSAVALAVFAAIEARAREAMLPLSLFQNPIFAVSSLAFFLVGLGLFGAMVYLPLFVQAVGGQTATRSGLILMPMMVTSFVSGVVGGQLLSRWGRYRILALFGAGTSALGMLILSRLGAGAGSSTLILGMVVLGLGFGVVMMLFIVIVQNAFPQRMVGVVIASSAFLRSLGGAIGVAVMGTVVGSRFLSSFQADLPPEAAAAMQKAGVALPASPQALLDPETVAAMGGALRGAGEGGQLPVVLETMRASLASALDSAFLLAAIALGLAFVACLFLREIPLRRSNVPEA